MKKLKNKQKLSAITFVLILTFAATFVTLPIVSAHDPPWEISTWAYIALTSDVIGVNQDVYFIYWSNAVPPTALGAYGDRWTFTVEVTKPDGSKVTLGPWESDPVGGGWGVYTPDQVGVYSFVAKMPDQFVTGEPVPPAGYFMGGGAFVNDTYLASSSEPVSLTVQQDPVDGWPEAPLPTEFWTRPINSMNRDWWQLAGNWLAGAAQTVGPTIRFGYGTGPESAHIMWATPMWAGGIMDARFGVTGYQTSHYEGLEFQPPIILNGKLYYNVPSLPREGWRVIDLYTGEELAFYNTTGPAVGAGSSSSGSIPGGSLGFGQIYDYESPNQHGGMPYLWSTSGPDGTWMMFDAYTGNYMCSIENVPFWAGAGFFFQMMGASINVYGKEGSILYYYIDPMNNLLQCWNTSRAIWYRDFFPSNDYWLWRPGLNVTYDGNNGYSLNVSIPAVQGSPLTVREGEFVIGGTSGKNNGTYVEQGQLWCLSLAEGEEGTLLWTRTYTPPLSVPDVAIGMFGAGGVVGPIVDPEDGVFYFSESITRQRWGYDLETGQLLWGPTEPEPSMNFYAMSDAVYEGKLFSFGYGGRLTAYNITTGDVLWTFNATNVGFESPYGYYPLFLDCIADGKLYMFSSEHSPTQPLWRGSYLRCINATDGEELWKINHWEGAISPALGINVGGAVIADGFLVGLNLYDNQIYCYGKGPSKTTVEAPLTAISLGENVVIRGTVTDECAGAKQLVQEGKFSNVPAISDEDMEEWMEYIYHQQAKPKDAEGVEVILETLDPNNNFYEIDTVTSDASGFYSLMWKPPVPGKYTIIATFEGTKSYYASYAETAIGVEEAVSPATPIEPEPTEPEPTEPAEAPFITTEIAIIIAVVIVAVIGIVAFWALRKRK